MLIPAGTVNGAYTGWVNDVEEVLVPTSVGKGNKDVCAGGGKMENDGSVGDNTEMLEVTSVRTGDDDGGLVDDGVGSRRAGEGILLGTGSKICVGTSEASDASPVVADPGGGNTKACASAISR